MQANAERDDHRGTLGVEPICKHLPIAPSTDYDHQAKRADPELLSDRAKRDAELCPEIRRVFEENWRVYGVRKVWRQLGREGVDVASRQHAVHAPAGQWLHGGTAPSRDSAAQCTTGQGMKEMGLQGAIPGKPHRTTIPDRKAPCPLDKVNRQFRVPGPNQLWVSDSTYVATWQGFVYVAPRHCHSDQWRSNGSMIDAFARRIVGWRVSRTAHAGFVLDALEQAVHQRQPGAGVRHWARTNGAFNGSLHHSDRGSQGGFNRSSQHPVDGGVDDDRKTKIRALDAAQIILARSAASLAA